MPPEWQAWQKQVVARLLSLLLLWSIQATVSPYLIIQAWDISLAVLSIPSSATGGEQWDTSPLLAIYNQDQSVLHSTLEGHVTLTSASEDSLGEYDFESNRCTDASVLQVNVSMGHANFSNVCVNQAGYYELIYTLYQGSLQLGDSLKSTMGVTVHVGPAHHVGIVQAPMVVHGGELFEEAVTVAILDRGENVIESASYGLVRDHGHFCLYRFY